jgi:tetratricopeptide (TPR) repeat protein
MKRQKKHPVQNSAAQRMVPPLTSQPAISAAHPPANGGVDFPFSPRVQGWLLGLLLVMATMVVYQPVWRAGFIWDDDAYVENNPALHDFNGLKHIWFDTEATPQYYPLVFTTFWLEYHAWQLNPMGYHVVNVLLHALGAILLWRALKRLALPGAWLAAAMFALHPVNVESVAWVTEHKNTLSGLFYLGSMLAALKFWLPGETSSESRVAGRDQDSTTGPGNWKFYWLAFVLYLCALCSKTTTLPLPAVILLLVWWKRGRIIWRDVYPLGLFLAAGAAMGLMTMHVENHLDAAGNESGLSWLERCLVAGRAVWFYLGKLLWPHPLIFVYPRWTIHASAWTAYVPGLALAAGLSILWWKRRGWGRPPLVAFLYFVALLFLVLGFFNVLYFRYSFVADHFQYLAGIGPLALAAAGITTACGLMGKKYRLIKPVFCGALLLALGVLTWRQCGMYADIETLWRTTLEQNPACWMARNNLGNALIQKGRLDEAIIQYQKALDTVPDNAEVHNSFGSALFQNGRTDEAIIQFQKALAIQPNHPKAENNLGNALIQKGRAEEAVMHWQKALAMQPGFAEADYNLGHYLLQKGRLDEAVIHFQKALAVQPGLVEAQNDLARSAWALATSPDAAVRNGTKAVELAQQADQLSGGRNPLMAATLAAAYAEAGKFGDAIATAQRALQLADGQKNDALAAVLQQEIKLYAAGTPLREATP